MHHHHHHHQDSPSPLHDLFWQMDHVELATVGIDVGSSTSHLLFARLLLRRLGEQLSSRFEVVKREVIHRSDILLTPYLQDDRIDAVRLDAFIHRCYEEAGLSPDQIDTGAVILTGEALKQRNARAIAELVSGHAGKFVCATAGHHLEAAIAAHGSGAVGRARADGATMLNVDVGGGTSKLALIRSGEVVETAAIGVGGRLIAFDGDGRIDRIEGSARAAARALGLELALGRPLEPDAAERLADALADALVQLIARQPLSDLARELLLTRPPVSTLPIEAIVFSGGVSEYLYGRETRAFGDLAPVLARALRRRIDAGCLPAPVAEPTERIRATVIGASQFTVQVSGNTLSISEARVLPLRNLPVLFPRFDPTGDLSPQSVAEAIDQSFQQHDLVEGDTTAALALRWRGTPSYRRLRALAEGIGLGLRRTVERHLPLVLVFDADVSKLIGELLRQELGVGSPVISIDGIRLAEFDYVDIGELIQPANVVPVVIKSLVFPDGSDEHPARS